MKYQESFDLLFSLMRNKAFTADVKQVNKSVEMMKDYLEAHGIACIVETFDDGRNALFASTRPGKAHKLLLNAHLDVVPESVPNQYEPVVKDGILYGRGASDCLGNATCAAQVLINAGADADIGVIFTSDEEDGGFTTSGMAHRGYVPTELACILDGGSLSSIAIGQKGICILKAVAHGHGGHSSAPWSFTNPILMLTEAFRKLDEAWKNPTADDQWHDTWAPCMINSGSANNQIPDDAEAVINIRFTKPGDIPRIIDFVKKTTGLDDVTVIRECEPAECSPDHPLIQRLIASLQALHPDVPVKTHRMNGATDARHLTFLNLPIAIFSLGGSGAHSANECIPIDNWELTIDAVTAFAKTFN